MNTKFMKYPGLGPREVQTPPYRAAARRLVKDFLKTYNDEPLDNGIDAATPVGSMADHAEGIIFRFRRRAMDDGRRSKMTQTKTAIVTGGSGGIGRELCRRLANDGFQVLVHYGSNQAEAAKVVEEICDSGGKAIACAADVADEAAVQQMFDTAEKQLGGIDVVVANAGTSGGAPIQDVDSDLFDRVVSVNFRAAFLTMREAARRLREGGRIIFISSMLARRPMAGSGVYSATKAGMDAMVRSHSIELGERGITVNSVRPGATVPGMFGKSDPERKERFRQMSPFKRLGTPADIAAAVSFLASEDGGWITGQFLNADGGASN